MTVWTYIPDGLNILGDLLLVFLLEGGVIMMKSSVYAFIVLLITAKFKYRVSCRSQMCCSF